MAAVNFMMSGEDRGQLKGLFVKEEREGEERSRKKATRFLLQLRARFYTIPSSRNTPLTTTA